MRTHTNTHTHSPDKYEWGSDHDFPCNVVSIAETRKTQDGESVRANVHKGFNTFSRLRLLTQQQLPVKSR